MLFDTCPKYFGSVKKNLIQSKTILDQDQGQGISFVYVYVSNIYILFTLYLRVFDSLWQMAICKKTAFNKWNVLFCFQKGFDPILQEGSRPKVRWLLVAFPESPCLIFNASSGLGQICTRHTYYVEESYYIYYIV